MARLMNRQGFKVSTKRKSGVNVQHSPEYRGKSVVKYPTPREAMGRAVNKAVDKVKSYFKSKSKKSPAPVSPKRKRRREQDTPTTQDRANYYADNPNGNYYTRN